MDTKISARQRKGIDALVAQQEELPGKTLVQLRAELAAALRGTLQRLPDALHIVHQHRVVHKIGIAVDADGNTVANAPFGSEGEISVVSQGRQRAARHSARHGCLWKGRRRAGCQQHQDHRPGQHGNSTRRFWRHRAERERKQAESSAAGKHRHRFMMAHDCKGFVTT